MRNMGPRVPTRRREFIVLVWVVDIRYVLNFPKCEFERSVYVLASALMAMYGMYR